MPMELTAQPFIVAMPDGSRLWHVHIRRPDGTMALATLPVTVHGAEAVIREALPVLSADARRRADAKPFLDAPPPDTPDAG